MNITTVGDDLQYANPAICTLFFLPLFYWSRVFSWYQSVKVHALLLTEHGLYIYQRRVIIYLMCLRSSFSDNCKPTIFYLLSIIFPHTSVSMDLTPAISNYSHNSAVHPPRV